MLAVSADQKQFQLLLNLNTKMLALWICAHEDNTSCPNILKEKQKDLGKSSKKHLRGAAAAELLRTLWDLDFSELKSLLLSSLGATYALPNAENFSQFTFAAAPTVSADLQIIGNPVVSKSQKAVISQKPAKVIHNLLVMRSYNYHYLAQQCLTLLAHQLNVVHFETL